MSITQVTQQEVDLVVRAYDHKALARKYILATKDCTEAEQEVRRLKQELNQYKKLAPIGCPRCHRGCFSNDKFCPHCGTKLVKKDGYSADLCIIDELHGAPLFYFQDEQGNRRALTDEEVREHLTEYQIKEAIEAKRNEPNEEVSYMTVGGYIVLDR